MISCCNITKKFLGQNILDDISLSIDEKCTVCIIGKSGCGKTTFLNIISGLLVPDGGSVMLDDVDITGKPGYISYMMQKDLLLEYRTVIENIVLPLDIRKESRKLSLDKACFYLDEFGLGEIKDKYPQELSLGMRQRVSFLRTCIVEPRYALLDEPFAALDAVTRFKIQRWVLSARKNINFGYLLVTHDIDEAFCLADKVFLLDSYSKNIKQVDSTYSKKEIFNLMIGSGGL